MNKQERIKELYFNKKYTQKKIAEILNTSTKYVGRILLNDDRYKNEKEQRKSIAKERHRKRTIDYIKNKRMSKNIDLEYEYLKQLHKQDSQELSLRKPIGNVAYRNWNSSAYKYNSKTKSYHLKKGIITGADVPKKVKWKAYN